jgi:hypothetical protein
MEAFNSLSAFANLEAAIIFIEEVIFRMFFTLFNRREMSFNVAMFLHWNATTGGAWLALRKTVRAAIISTNPQSI